MTIFYNSLQESHLGYSAIFACIGIGFLFLRKVDKDQAGPEYWAASFILNSLGFLCWSGLIPITPWKYFLIGEVLHISGFLFLVCGAYRFAGNEFRKWNLFVLSAVIALWIGAILLWHHTSYFTALTLKGVRAILFISAGALILRSLHLRPVSGRRLTGWSLIGWGLYVVVFAFLKLETAKNLAYGFLAGFEILAAFGMIAMIVDRVRIRAEQSEKLIKRLEGLLPICAYCKKIRDSNSQWKNLESYIEEHTTAEFSHGICPDCLAKHHPDVKI